MVMRILRTFAIVLSAVICLTAAVADAQQRKAPSKKGVPKQPPLVVGLVCTWSAYSVNKESLLIDVRNKTAYWVNQNQKLKVLQFNSGRLVLAGVRKTLRVSQSQTEKKVPLQMVLNRISGEFIVRQKAHPYQGPGSCRKQRLF